MRETGGSQSDDTFFERTTWPDALPHPSASFMTAICGNTHTSWALGSMEPPKPGLHTFWRCLAPSPEMEKQPLFHQLNATFPGVVKQRLFGADHIDIHGVISSFSNHRCPIIHVYIVASDQHHAQNVAKMLKAINARVFNFSASTIMPGNKSAYPGIGIDRVVCVRGAGKITGYPALVIDGGTALTYTATNEKGDIIGGGISPGLRSKLDAMHQHTSALPCLSPQHLVKRIEEKELDLFARNTEDAMFGSVLLEARAFLHYVVEEWAKRAAVMLDLDYVPDDGVRYNQELKVLATGGDSEVITSLLSSEKKIFTDTMPSQTSSGEDRVVWSKMLPHLGIFAVIEENLNMTNNLNRFEEKIRQELVGQRVAISDPNKESSTPVLGTIGRCCRATKLSDDRYEIFVDDLSRVEVALKECQEGLELFQKHSTTSAKKTEGIKAAKILKDGLFEESNPKVSAKPALPASNPKSGSASRKPAPLKPAPVAAKPSNATLGVLSAIHKELPLKALGTNDKTAAKRKASGDPNPANGSKKKEVKVADIRSNPAACVDRRMCKFFDKDLYFGQVSDFIKGCDVESGADVWAITYDDGDSEDLEIIELQSCLTLYERFKEQEPKNLR